MNRRRLLKSLTLMAGGIAFLPSCLHKDSAIRQLKNIALEEGDQNLIAEICEALIPETETPGAKNLNLPDFVIKMIDEGYSRNDQHIFMKGFQDFKAEIKIRFHKEFSFLTKQEKDSYLERFEGDFRKVPLSSSYRFYQMVKSETIFAYITSKYFMTKVLVYELVPGRYKVHVSADKKKLV